MSGSAENATEGLEAAPHYRIVECDDGVHKFEITYDVGGFRPEDVKITLENDNKNLVVTAKKEEKKGNSTVAREFKRQLEIPSSVDSQHFQCTWDKTGHLKVIAPLRFNSAPTAHQHSTTLVSTPGQWTLNTSGGVGATKSASAKPSSPLLKSSTEKQQSDGPCNTYNYSLSKSKSVPQHQHHLAVTNKSSTACNEFGGSESNQTNRISSNSAKEGRVLRGPSGPFYELVLPISQQMAKSDETVVEIHDKSKTVKMKFKVVENCGGWSETKDIVRSVKLASDIHLRDLEDSRAFVDPSKCTLTVVLPLVHAHNVHDESEDIREVRTKVIK